jgi:RecA/RadA recombinase
MIMLVDMVLPQQMSGGSGLKYAASTIIYLSKSKEKDGTDVIGNIIRAKTSKVPFE